MPEPRIEIEGCGISAAAYTKAVMRKFAADWWPAMLIVVSLAAMLSFLDIRWLIVALMTLFIIAPMLLFFFYVWHCMKPEARYSIAADSAVLDAEGLTIRFSDNENDEKTLPWRLFNKANLCDGFLTLNFVSSRYLLLILPCDQSMHVAVKYALSHYIVGTPSKDETTRQE